MADQSNKNYKQDELFRWYVIYIIKHFAFPCNFTFEFFFYIYECFVCQWWHVPIVMFTKLAIGNDLIIYVLIFLKGT